MATLVFTAPANAAVRRDAPNHKIGHSTSSNWAGYDVTGGTYTAVSASTVDQTGTEADCSSGRAVYSAWYEMYPEYPKTYPDAVAPGDHFTASVTTDARGAFTLTLSDTTRETTSARLKSAKPASAEVIAEAPSSSGGVLPPADFGTVGFSAATVNGAPPTSSTPGIDPITMGSDSTTRAQASSISSGSFSVAWKHQ